MLSSEEVLAVSCPKCGATANTPCLRSRGQVQPQTHVAREKRARTEPKFWDWVDRRLADPDCAGMTEQEFLDTVRRPGWTGMKARSTPHRGKVIQMPLPEYWGSAASNSDEAA